MTQKRQNEFVVIVLNSIMVQMMNEVEAGKIPQRWRSRELIQLMIDRLRSKQRWDSWTPEKREAYRQDCSDNCI